MTGQERDLAAAKIAQYIERIVAEAPLLTDEQADRIAAILRGGAAPVRSSREAKPETEYERTMRANAERLRRIQRDLSACGYCGVPEEGHSRNHSHVALDEKQILAVLAKIGGDTPGTTTV